MFLGHQFRPLTLPDLEMLQDYLRRYPQHVSGYTFATLAAYAPIYGILWSQVGPECLLLARRLDDDNLHLLQPIGQPTDACCDGLLEAAGLAHRARVAGSSPAFEAMSYPELWQCWRDSAPTPGWLDEHLENLQGRYLVSI